MGAGAPIERVNTIVERFRAIHWLVAGLGASLVLGASVVPLVGGAELGAGIGAVLAGVLGVGGAFWRRRLEQLPLTIAPELADLETPMGRQLTVRAWLGRGRRLEQVRFEVLVDGAPLAVLSPEGPVVGCFQAVFPYVDGEVLVRIEGQGRDGKVSSERLFAGDARVQGRFAPGFSCSGGGWSWHRRDWARIQGTMH